MKRFLVMLGLILAVGLGTAFASSAGPGPGSEELGIELSQSELPCPVIEASTINLSDDALNMRLVASELYFEDETDKYATRNENYSFQYLHQYAEPPNDNRYKRYRHSQTELQSASAILRTSQPRLNIKHKELTCDLLVYSKE